MKKHLEWPYKGGSFRFLNFEKGKLRDFIDQEIRPFEVKLGKLLPESYFAQFEEERKAVEASIDSAATPAMFKAEEDIGYGQFYVEMNPYDFTDSVPHLGLIFGPPTPGRDAALKHAVGILSEMPEVSILKNDSSIFYRGILSPRHLGAEKIVEAVIGRYSVIVHRMIRVHEELGEEILLNKGR